MHWTNNEIRRSIFIRFSKRSSSDLPECLKGERKVGAETPGRPDGLANR